MLPSAMPRLFALLLVSLPCAVLAGGPGAFITSVRVEAMAEPESSQALFTVEPDTSYPLLKKGGPGRKWCKLRGATAEGWVLCDGAEETAVAAAPGAGVLAEADKTPELGVLSTAAPEASGCAATCAQARLFPEPPSVSEVDREVLALCPSRPDGSVSAEAIHQFFSKHYEDKALQQALAAAGRTVAGPEARQANLTWLTGLWTGTGPRNAFTYVFCGDDWTRGLIGGLHFLPRYAQLEAEGKVCFTGPARGDAALQGDNYLIQFRGVAPWSCGEKKLGGFSRSQGALSIAAIGAQAFANCCARDGAKTEGGVYAVPGLDGATWKIRCGTRNGTYGISSLYPTSESPTCAQPQASR
ncbi:hypothetical protein [Stigmatella erecta]|uniref:SH3 domain-containing protein n=1 Tax=Stigmatella erecta TaxID=83460 RepID=A0A1I0L1Y1_9BACT|nr:hypothetical protein [Stigmatella erecta]SEU33442.1 hypothetical protein SAMN05443639_117103 [Stigmatella erecta]